MEILTSEQMRQADRAAIVGMNIPSLKLMENAGAAVAREVDWMARQNSPEKSCRMAILCGKGNNGGDGLVAARRLARLGHKVTAFLTSEKFSRDASVQLKRLPDRVTIARVHSLSLWKKEKSKLLASAVIVDALFGTGLSNPLKGLMKQIVEDIHHAGIPVVAADIPSGIDATTGQILGPGGAAVRADATVTFARPKIGHMFYPGAVHTGRLIVADIGIPDSAVLAASPDTFLTDRKLAAELLPRRPPHSHKGTFGRSVILAGSRGMIGAAVLAAEAALRIGSGLTTLMVPESLYVITARKLSPEIMCEPVPERGRGAFDARSMKGVLDFLERATAILIGPGIGRRLETLRWVIHLLRKMPPGKKVILDADALYAISAPPFKWPTGLLNVAITPHAGEMSRLIGKTRKEVESNACLAAREYSKKYSINVVLKGSRTLIVEPSGSVYVNSTGNSALAKGGTGDVLAGMICGLAAQGLSVFDASRLAVYLHGRAADIAISHGRDKRTFVASDIFKTLDPALLELSEFKSS